MIEKLLRVLPFKFYKHYVRPFVRLIGNRNKYHNQYDARSYFDQFYKLSNGRDDRFTIGPDFPAPDARFHYNTVENEIISYLKRNATDMRKVLDIGSGTGHWIDFYMTVFDCRMICGVEISQEAVRKVTERFEDEKRVHIFQTDVLESDIWKQETFGLINAIGVLFHIISDDRWEETIRWCYERLLPRGVLVANDLFGILTANVQFGPERFSTIQEYYGAAKLACNKRVRSKRLWKQVLTKSGFREMTFKKVKIPTYIHTPENNMVFAVK